MTAGSTNALQATDTISSLPIVATIISSTARKYHHLSATPPSMTLHGSLWVPGLCQGETTPDSRFTIDQRYHKVHHRCNNEDLHPASSLEGFITPVSATSLVKSHAMTDMVFVC